MTSNDANIFLRTLNILVNDKMKDEKPFIDLLIKRKDINEKILEILDKSRSSQIGNNEKYLMIALSILDKYIPTDNAKLIDQYFQKISNYSLILSSYEGYKKMEATLKKLRQNLPSNYQIPTNQIVESLFSDSKEILNKAFVSNYISFPSDTSLIGFSFITKKLIYKNLEEENRKNLESMIQSDSFYDSVSQFLDDRYMVFYIIKIVKHIMKHVNMQTGLKLCLRFADTIRMKYNWLDDKCKQEIINIIKKMPSTIEESPVFNPDTQLSLIAQPLSMTIKSFDDEMGKIFAGFTVDKKNCSYFTCLYNNISNYGLLILVAKCGIFDEVSNLVIEYMCDNKFCLETFCFLLKEKVFTSEIFFKLNSSFYAVLTSDFANTTEAEKMISEILDQIGTFSNDVADFFIHNVCKIKNEEIVFKLCKYLNENYVEAADVAECPIEVVASLGRYVVMSERSTGEIITFLDKLTKKGHISDKPLAQIYCNFFFKETADYKKCLFGLIQNYPNEGYEIMASGISNLTEKEIIALTKNMTEFLNKDNPTEVNVVKENLYTIYFRNLWRINADNCLKELLRIVKKETSWLNTPPLVFNHAVFNIIESFIDSETMTVDQTKKIIKIVEKALPSKKVNIVPNVDIVIQTIKKLSKLDKCVLSNDLCSSILKEDLYQDLIPVVIRRRKYKDTNNAIVSLFTNSLNNVLGYSYKEQITAIFETEDRDTILHKFCNVFASLNSPGSDTSKIDVTKITEFLLDVTEIANLSGVRYTESKCEAKFLKSMVDVTFSPVDALRIPAINILINLFKLNIQDNTPGIRKYERVNLFYTVWEKIIETEGLPQGVAKDFINWCVKDINNEAKAIIITASFKKYRSLFIANVFKVQSGTQSYIHIFNMIKEYARENLSGLIELLIKSDVSPMVYETFTYLLNKKHFFKLFIPLIPVANLKSVYTIIEKYNNNNSFNPYLFASIFAMIGADTHRKYGEHIKVLIEQFLCIRFQEKWDLKDSEDFFNQMRDFASALADIDMVNLREILNTCTLLPELNIRGGLLPLGVVFANIASLLSKSKNSDYLDIAKESYNLVCLCLEKADAQGKSAIIYALNISTMIDTLKVMKTSIKRVIISNCSDVFEQLGNSDPVKSKGSIELLCSLLKSIKLSSLDETLSKKVFTTLDNSVKFGIRYDVISCAKDMIEYNEYEIRRDRMISPQSLLEWSVKADRGDIMKTAWEILCFCSGKKDLKSVFCWVCERVKSIPEAANSMIKNCTLSTVTKEWMKVLNEYSNILIERKYESNVFFANLYTLLFDIIDDADNPLYDDAIEILDSFK